jgi:hypothetical protein
MEKYIQKFRNKYLIMCNILKNVKKYFVCIDYLYKFVALFK